MKFLAISSSSRKNGNTSILLNHTLAELHKEGIETEMLLLSGQIIEPCKACGDAMENRIASTAMTISGEFSTR